MIDQIIKLAGHGTRLTISPAAQTVALHATIPAGCGAHGLENVEKEGKRDRGQGPRAQD
jgi:hypothetical protein